MTETSKEKKLHVVPSRLRGESGFTLVELGVVMVIIGVLASLMSTAFNSTKAKARQMSCLNNLRQLQVSWFIYTHDNDDHLPLNKTVSSALNSKYFGRRNSTNSWVAGNPKEDTTTENLTRGTLFPYVKTTSTYRCPADRSTVLSRKDVLRTRSYAMSAYLAGDAEGVDGRVKMRYSELINPSPDKIFVFIEEHEASAWNGAFAVIPSKGMALNSDNWLSAPSDRHNQGCNLSFADGHVEYWRWYAPKTYNGALRGTSGVRDAMDLKRIQESTPKP